MSHYLFDTSTTFLNALTFGDLAGNALISPQLQQIITANRTLDAVQALGQLQTASLYGQRETLRVLAGINGRVESLSTQLDQSTRQITLSIDTGFQAISRSLSYVSRGIADVNSNLQAIAAELVSLNANLRNQEANRASEHFRVAMNFINALDFERAIEQLEKAKAIYAGQFETYFALGFCYRMLNKSELARAAFQMSTSQVDVDPNSARRQRAMSYLYLGRIDFDLERYDDAYRNYGLAHQNDPSLRNAVVEGAASLLLDPSRSYSRTADGNNIKQDFNSRELYAYQYWYLLAGTIVARNESLARDALQQGMYGDPSISNKDKVSFVALLWRLNQRSVEKLVSIAKAYHSWLN